MPYDDEHGGFKLFIVFNFKLCLPMRHCTNAPAEKHTSDPVWIPVKSRKSNFPDHVISTRWRRCSYLLSRSASIVIMGLLFCSGDVHINPWPSLCKLDCFVCNNSVNSKHKYRCILCENIAHPNCVGITQKLAQTILANSLPWCCSDCCAPCGICYGNVLNDHHAVQCNMWQMAA